MTKPIEIAMNERERALYLAGEASGIAKGLEAAAKQIGEALKQATEYSGGEELRQQLATFGVKWFPTPRKQGSKQALRKSTEALAELEPIGGAVPLLCAMYVKLIAELQAQIADGATQSKAAFAQMVAQVPSPKTLIQRVATSALRKMSQG